MTTIRLPYIQNVDQLSVLSPSARQALKPVGERFKFRTNEYYNSLIDWNDPNDPLRLLVVPHESELDEEYGSLDASGEAEYTVVKGLQHKYERTGLLLVSKVCAAYCRFCFRKRLFEDDNDETTHDIVECAAYIKQHPEIESIVLSGGDPMLLSNARLVKILDELAAIPHVKTIRIDTKILAFNPFRISEDPELVEILRTRSTEKVRIYIIAQYTHPNELTPESIRALRLVQAANVNVYNQMPLLRGINAEPGVVADISNRLAQLGVTPYYVFIARPVLGNKRFALPLREAWNIYREGVGRCTGLGRTARLMMSHRTGKVEVVGFDGDRIVLRYQQAPEARNQGRLVTARVHGHEMWLDDLVLDGPSSAEARTASPAEEAREQRESVARRSAAAVQAAAARAAETFGWYGARLAAGAAVPPLLTQEILDAHHYVEAPRPGRDAYFTSGSATGQRRRIEYTAADQERYLQTKSRVFGEFLRTRRFAVEKVVTDVGTGHAANTAAEVFRRCGVAHENIRFSDPIQQHVAALRAAQPQVLYTMPSILEALVKNCDDPRSLSLKGVILVGECAGQAWINAWLTRRLGIAGIDVMDTYGSIEVGLIAHYAHDVGRYRIEDDVVAEVVSPQEVGLREELRKGEGILVVTSLIRDGFPAVRLVTYDVVRGFRPASPGHPASFESVVRRVGTEFKHGEKISLHDVETVVYRYLDDATVRVRSDGRRLHVLIDSAELTPDLVATIRGEIHSSIPEIGNMVEAGVLDGVQVDGVKYAEMPMDTSRVKQRIAG